jgi:hypothetical protein
MTEAHVDLVRRSLQFQDGGFLPLFQQHHPSVEKARQADANE